MAKAPERVWLGKHSQDKSWEFQGSWNTRAFNNPDIEQHEYVRKDLADRAVEQARAELESHIATLEKELAGYKRLTEQAETLADKFLSERDALEKELAEANENLEYARKTIRHLREKHESTYGYHMP